MKLAQLRDMAWWFTRFPSLTSRRIWRYRDAKTLYVGGFRRDDADDDEIVEVGDRD